MRSVSLEELEEHTAELVAEVESGQQLTVLRGGKAVATVSPAQQRYPLPEGPELEATRKDLLEMLRKGFDLGGLRVNRDQLYDDAI